MVKCESQKSTSAIILGLREGVRHHSMIHAKHTPNEQKRNQKIKAPPFRLVPTIRAACASSAIICSAPRAARFGVCAHRHKSLACVTVTSCDLVPAETFPSYRYRGEALFGVPAGPGALVLAFARARRRFPPHQPHHPAFPRNLLLCLDPSPHFGRTGACATV
jgi:hypothetical protein